MDNKLNMGQLSITAPSKANLILGCIYRSITSRERDHLTLLSTCKAARGQFWVPHNCICICPYSCIAVFKGICKEDGISLFTRSHYKEQWEQIASGLVSSLHKKEFFYSESSHSLERTPQGHSRVPISGSFQDAIGQDARQSYLGSLCHKRWKQKIFRSPFQLGLFYDFMILRFCMRERERKKEK